MKRQTKTRTRKTIPPQLPHHVTYVARVANYSDVFSDLFRIQHGAELIRRAARTLKATPAGSRSTFGELGAVNFTSDERGDVVESSVGVDWDDPPALPFVRFEFDFNFATKREALTFARVIAGSYQFAYAEIFEVVDGNYTAIREAA